MPPYYACSLMIYCNFRHHSPLGKHALDISSAPTSSGISSSSYEFLTFTLGQEEYGIAILNMQEIRGYDAVTGLANMPEFIKGVTNLRGVIVPIVNMRIKFHLGHVEYNELTVVIILNVASRVIGMVVDGMVVGRSAT